MVRRKTEFTLDGRRPNANPGRVGVARFDLLPAEALEALARHVGDIGHIDNGCQAADHRFAAMQRHSWAWRRGEARDPSTGSHHLIAAAWHALTLYAGGPGQIDGEDRARRARRPAEFMEKLTGTKSWAAKA